MFDNFFDDISEAYDWTEDIEDVEYDIIYLQNALSAIQDMSVKYDIDAINLEHSLNDFIKELELEL